MGLRSITAVACTALLVAAGGAVGAAAQTSDRTTYVTFSGPVSIPGKTLPAGTYTFRLADSPADRHIVQIFDREQAQLFATLLAVPAERDRPEGEPVITFRETPSNMPPALRYWYYAGETGGNEFVYPKTQAMTIARASGEGVMAVDTDSTNVTEWKGTPERVTANAEPQTGTAASTTSPTASTATTTEPVAAQPTTTPERTTQPTTPQPTQQPTTTTDQTAGTSGRSEPSELPRTAGELPSVGLIALFALAGAFALRVARKAVV